MSRAPTVNAAPTSKLPPAQPRALTEFRGVFVATVANIDWPSRPGLPIAEQQAELVRLLDLARRLRLNVIIFQVRPAADAFYASPYEPWSEFLTGRMGTAPQPFYDPLAFAITEAHRRGMQLHAWVNPFRASHPKATGPVAPQHITRTHPQWVRTYGRYRWIDPGEPAAVDHVLQIIGDIVGRYDVDGILIDDYFYPYPEGRADFPDDETYRRSAATLTRADWRRENINRFVQRLYSQTKQIKPHVQVGISPAGIWRSGHPSGIRGSGSYDTTFADARLWLQRGWLDYCAPQLYWRIDAPEQSFPALLNWWIAQNHAQRKIVPALFTSRVADGSSQQWPASEIAEQIAIVRATPGASGFIHFSMRAFLENRDGLTDLPSLRAAN
ncbi:MAG: family 10 glycosylhydrolase [Verrucomicrobiae bacterium]|nr:family 10 glycosylhydrolase [Verrucomicrobiae bacterium]